MPKIISRMDHSHWFTPSMNDVLKDAGNNNTNSQSTRDFILAIQRELNDMGTPIKIVNVRNLPSHTLFVAKAESIGRLGNRRNVKASEIENNVMKLAETHSDWIIGFSANLANEDKDSVGIYLRTREHRPHSLRRLLVRNAFRQQPSQFAYPAGITLDQRLIVHDLLRNGHILIVDNERKHYHLARAMLLTLLLMNTPSELRFSIIGEQVDPYRYYVGAPHALGNLITNVDAGIRLLIGLEKEINRRQMAISRQGCETFDEYNQFLLDEMEDPFPHVMVVIDNISSDGWHEKQDEWLPTIKHLVQEGAEVGIHLMIVTDDHKRNRDVVDFLLENIPEYVVFTSVIDHVPRELESFHDSLTQFVEAYAYYLVNERIGIEPVEIYTVSNQDIKQTIRFWREVSKQRTAQMNDDLISGKTGVTDMLNAKEDNRLKAPPIPEVPHPETLQRATQILEDEQPENFVPVVNKRQNYNSNGSGVAVLEPEVAPNIEILSDDEIAEELIKNSQLSHMPVEEKQVSASNFLTSAEEAEKSNENIIPDAQPVAMPEPTVQVALLNEEELGQAVALGAYLGWLGAGPLHDILLWDMKKAEEAIRYLQENGYIEVGKGRALRFLRF